MEIRLGDSQSYANGSTNALSHELHKVFFHFCRSPSLAVVTSQIDSYMKCRNNSNIFLHYEKFVLWRKKAPYNSYIFDYNFKRRDDHTGHQEQKEFEDPDASDAERSAGTIDIKEHPNAADERYANIYNLLGDIFHHFYNICEIIEISCF